MALVAVMMHHNPWRCGTCLKFKSRFGMHEWLQWAAKETNADASISGTKPSSGRTPRQAVSPASSTASVAAAASSPAATSATSGRSTRARMATKPSMPMRRPSAWGSSSSRAAVASAKSQQAGPKSTSACTARSLMASARHAPSAAPSANFTQLADTNLPSSAWKASPKSMPVAVFGLSRREAARMPAVSWTAMLRCGLPQALLS
mmetsp:Transcript_24389/g.69313  ORF Transcript_24389/g.69313 Transcript_24389/m.69313 type:complete len:205 (-) Transcript_24389:582-1196(-)